MQTNKSKENKNMMKLLLIILMIAGLVAMTTLIFYPPVSQIPVIYLPSWYIPAFLAAFGASFCGAGILFVHCASETEEQTKER